MNKIIFTEEFCQPENLHPFTLTRQMQDIRVGILTIREKWEMILELPSFDKKEDDYKDMGRSVNLDEAAADGSCFMIHGNLLPTPKLIKAVKKLKNGEFISTGSGNGIIYRFSKNEIQDKYKIKVGRSFNFLDEIYTIEYPWDIFKLNDFAIRQDFVLLTSGKKSAKISKTNNVTRPSQVFIEKGAKVTHSIINASTGPVYIGKNAEVMEGCIIRGPFAMGENSCLKMGTKVYGATSLGPQCVLGGEIKNSMLFGFSNKAHDGYLGDSVIGEWCNLGAGTTNSNIKNNASDVRVWTPHGELNAGKKCGVMMGDYSRTAVGTLINTGTVVGVNCNVFGNGLTPKNIPSFSWGSEGVTRYSFDKAMADIEDWKKLKGRSLGDEEKKVLKYIYDNY
ncbi:MAG TPA: putative sugar nucleotidyl transferase [Chitinophagaceae bacterium]|nr:glucose-1-phosphate thymidylyltransferase [Chitinophagaceae bacterium]MCB9055944.1 glucose-1-phosphate thymidylyltransferase [Chitinophagales bacterium]HPG10440.1 putative sugar nucleotidyl transferase [Chitinophagaceae bacterium]HRX93085.1 putative sugar nucleotidyl transferase [Chitinophagaceae bacterium]